MKYMMLIHQGPDIQDFENLPEEEKAKIQRTYQEIRETPGVVAGERLQWPEMATTVRVQDGETLITDGPFAELKEAIGGYMMFETDDLDAAIELAAKIPAAHQGGGVEIRPLWEG